MFLHALLATLNSAPPALALPASVDDALPPPRAARVEVKGPQRKALLDEDAANEAAGPGPRRIAVSRRVSGDLDTLGEWHVLPDGRRAWQAVFQAATAEHLSLSFEEAALPEGAELWLESTDGRHALKRPLTARHARTGQLWTPLVMGDSVRAVLTIPAATRAVLTGMTVHVGYRRLNAPPPQGSCNIDVVCPEASGWEEEIAAAAVYSFGGDFSCSGSMLGNTSDDETPLFSTADHCGVRNGNASSVVVYWNYESPNCGDLSGGQPDDWQVGATLLARISAADWGLIRLDDAPDPAWEVSWAGWDRRDQATAAAVAIHHPGTDEKAISFEDDPTVVTEAYGNSPDPTGTHIRVVDWDLGTTEGGSSGSPLFSEDHRVVGVLTGGGAACGNDESDWYGRLAAAWDGSSSSRRLRDWLDPSGTDAVTVDTLAPWARGVVARPSTGLQSEGPEGGPFSPPSSVVSITNRDEAPRQLVFTSSADWVEMVEQDVTISPTETIDVNLALSDAAEALSAGVYEATVTASWDGDDPGTITLPVELVVGTPALRYAFPLDRDPRWETEGDWAYGVPEGRGGSTGSPDPRSGATGEHVYGYNLAGDYTDNLRAQHLTTRPLDMRNQLGTKLRFQRWLGVEEGIYDHATVSVSTDGDGWTTVWENSGEIDDGGWTSQEIDLTGVADNEPEVWIRWTMGSTDESVTYCGWNIDDIEIYGIQTGEWEPLPEDTGDPGEDTATPDTDTPDEPDSAAPDSATPDDDDDDDNSISACACSTKGTPSGAMMALLLGAVGLLRRRDHRS